MKPGCEQQVSLIGRHLPHELLDAIDAHIDHVHQQIDRWVTALGILISAGLFVLGTWLQTGPGAIVSNLFGALALLAVVALRSGTPGPASDNVYAHAFLSVLNTSPAYIVANSEVLEAGGRAWLEAQQIDLDLFIGLAQHNHTPARQVIEAARLLNTPGATSPEADMSHHGATASQSVRHHEASQSVRHHEASERCGG